MKRNLSQYVVFGLVCLSVFVPVSYVLAAGGIVHCGLTGTETCTWNDLYIIINSVINFLIFKLGVPLVTIVIVVSGVQLVWGQNESAYKAAKDRLKTALWGLLIMLTAFLIVKAVVWGLTGGDNAVTDPYNLRGGLINKTN